MYQLPNYNFKKTKENLPTFVGLALLIFVLIFSVFYSGAIPGDFLKNIDGLLKNPGVQETSRLNEAPDNKYVSDISYEQAIINVVKSAAPSVVSIVVFKNTPVYQEQLINPFGDDSPFNIKIPQYVQRGSELKEVGGASGFIVSSDGLVLTNKHVVLDDKAQYTVIGSDGKKYDAKVLALDPVQDLAILKIEGSGFEAIKLGNSDNIEVGQGAIAIGNSLGKFSNTVSVGIVSGLERTIDASTQTGDFYETLEGIIQTDAAINQGNSGGPLLNLKGEVIGVNVATATGAQSIGFAIPINLAIRDIKQIIATNKIVYPFLGVRHSQAPEGGALLVRGD